MLLNTPFCDFGWQAPDFKLADPDGNITKLADLMDGEAFLIAFICNHCPYVQAIMERLVADAKILQGEGVKFVAIMSNDYRDYPDDSPENMKRFIQQYNMNFPYLVDETQAVGKAYGAVCTPDFFGFNKKGELQYRGRLDDLKMGDGTSRKTELLDAMRQIIATDKGPTQQIPSMGCSIKWRA